jgi:hypothetical protein
MNITHKNHYVPIWYQKRFVADGKSLYYCLDKQVEYKSIPNKGCIKIEEVQEKGPKNFFYEEDLYTTNSIFSGVQNDEIEKFLFGKIDIEGKKAFEALMSKNWANEMHERYSAIFEYMDAQFLRTPRGISWLKQISNTKTQNDIMFFMQKIRLSNCITWIESAKEIVSAEKSSTKFIVSDNPITLYNPKYHPSKGWTKSEHISIIPIFHKGTRTIFPIDMNHCLILYNPEYTQNPSVSISIESRTNPRLYDNVLCRVDDIKKTRILSEKEVIEMNYLLKNNASRFIAAAKKDWLFPEKYARPSWLSFNKLLLPKFPKYPGGIFTFGNDGNLSYVQDGFGRKPRNQDEWNKKAEEAKKMHESLQRALENEKKKKV